MKILIIEAYTDGNIGSASLVENSIYLLQKYFPKAKIEILAQFPEHIKKFSGLPSFPELISMPFKQSRVKQVVWLLKTLFWMISHSLAMIMKKKGAYVPIWLYTYDERKLLALDRIEWADMVVSVGAERINDNFYKAILFSLFMLWAIRLHKKFLILFPQTIGPFHFRLTRFLSKKILNSCDVIYLRDKKSYKTILELGIKNPIIANACDVAILQRVAPIDEAKKILNNANVPDDGKPLVGISALRWDYIKAKGKSRYEDYRYAIARVADKMIEEKEARIVFLATNMPVHGCREDDIDVARDIISSMKKSESAHIVNQLCTPAQMKSIMGLLEMCLVTRMHACIFSTGILTPTFSINYQFKLHEYMRLVGLEDYTIDIDNVTYERLKEIADKTWNNRKRIREILEEKIASCIAILENEISMLPNNFMKKYTS